MIGRLRSWRLAVGVLAVLGSPVLASELKLERVAMLMRHGIRPPTQLQPIPIEYSPRTWPQWKVGPGLLTDHGAQGIALLGQWDRTELAERGMIAASGCPSPDDVTIRASKVPRAVSTAQAWAASFAPGCGLAVAHPEKEEPDSLFHPLEGQPSSFDGQAALEDALKNGTPADAAAHLAPQLRELATVLGCAPPRCDLEQQPSALVAQPHGRPSLQGPLNAAATASETLLLEYLENKPMAEVGWGLVDRARIERLLVFTAVKFRFEDRPAYIAKAASGPLAKAMLAALAGAYGPRLSLFAGHDTNIADLAGLLDLHWRVPTYPPDTVPPGSAIGFELLSDQGGQRFVRAFYRSQDMDQLRGLQPLNAANPAHRSYIDIPGCAVAAAPRSCRLEAFTALVESRLNSP